MTLGEKLFVGIPACIVVLLAVDQIYTYDTPIEMYIIAFSRLSWHAWTQLIYGLLSGYLTLIIWENRHNLRNPTNG